MCDDECGLVERLAQLDDNAWEEFCRGYPDRWGERCACDSAVPRNWQRRLSI